MKKRLLIVDDEPSIGLILEHYFAKEYLVQVKSNGQEAMTWLQEGHHIDAIVADFEMPLMNGLDFIKQLRATTKFSDIPLIMLSGKDETSNKITCLKQGADDYMIKPFNPEELDIRIKNVLRRIKA
ncbi:response regulator transcription factor [Adhaeribacter radiodurans]|uniref:Response regulator transcription factor n=1 Tax=Adhaeribacter radiodurans TaxID=2745197 RepID=A0A7L7L4L6_9BACT|nr:response regulator transcription factor [Adhaeribacter radiodurans]QMU27714.1 response regulator transcription factor [Adhaeribacter radiodurans]